MSPTCMFTTKGLFTWRRVDPGKRVTLHTKLPRAKDCFKSFFTKAANRLCENLQSWLGERVTLGRKPTLSPYKQFGYFCLACQGQVVTFGACTNATIGQKKIVGGKIVQKMVLVNVSRNLILEKTAKIDVSKHLSPVF